MKKSIIFLVMLAMLTSLIVPFAVSAAAPAGFVTASGPNFALNGKPFYYAGTNNYYLCYKSQLMVDDIFNDAAAMNLKVIRTWGFLDCGTKNADGTFTNNSTGGGPKDGYYITYWDPTTNAPAYNTGATGLVKLDYVLYKASQLGIKIIVTLTNNWGDFGGAEQYAKWIGSTSKDDFFKNAILKSYFKSYISTILNRTNSYTGIKYKDDPAVFSWELCNEPRCETDTSGDTLVNWATEMSAYIKSIDPNHMVDVGDEGFYNLPYGVGEYNSAMYHPGFGDDYVRFINIPTIDFGSLHLYPDTWGVSADWGTTWIKEHVKDGYKAGKPVVLGEYGMRSNKDTVYPTWLNTVMSTNCAGDNYWILSGIQDDGSLYADYDGFTVYYPSTTATIISNHALAMAAKTTQSPMEPLTFNQLTPANHSTGLSTLPTFTWEEATGATSYTLEITTDGGFGTISVTQAGITGTSYTLTAPLSPYGNYYWRVIAKNAQGTTIARNSRMQFSTGNSTATSTPVPATATPTPTPSTATVTPTATPSAATATPTPTPSTATATPTPTPSTATATPTPSTATATPTPTPSTATATPTPTPSTATATPTPTPSTATATPTPTPSVATATPTPTPTAGTPLPGGIKVQFFNGNTAATTNTLYPNFKVVNTGTAAISLSDVKVRYYFTNDGSQTNSFACDYSTIGSGNVTSSFATIAKTNADRYLEIGFSTSAGTLAAGAGAEVKGRVWKSDWSNFTQTNDYSFNSTATNYVDATTVTGYIAGALKWGTEP